MKRPLIALALCAALLGACGGASQSQRTEAQPSDADTATASTAMVIGTWVEGQDRLVLDRDGTYLWEREQACDAPPCLLDQSSGTYTYDGANLRLTTVEGPDLLIAVQVHSDPRRVTLRDPGGRAWSLPFVE